MDALTAHYGLPGRLADYWRQFERTTRTVGEDPAIFSTALETLAVKAFGDMGQTGRLRLIRDRFIAGHSNCDLRRYLDSVPPEAPIRDVVDRCRVWESHADPAVRQVGKPSPDPVYPAYAVGDADNNIETTRVATVTGQRSSPSQLEDLLRRVLAPAEPPAPEVGGAGCGEIVTATGEGDTESSTCNCEPSSADGFGTDVTLLPRRPAPTTVAASTKRPAQRDWTDVVCFSCGKSGHAATRCLNFDESFPSMQPGWRTEKTPGEVIMIPPLVITDRRRAENGG